MVIRQLMVFFRELVYLQRIGGILMVTRKSDRIQTVDGIGRWFVDSILTLLLNVG